jgi:hypothetical protein
MTDSKSDQANWLTIVVRTDRVSSNHQDIAF